jgi:8-oxo-dGTP diphosphatase
VQGKQGWNMTNKNNIHVLSRAVIIDQGHILLCKALNLPRQLLCLPGGHIEQGESAEAAVLRELLEESGSKCTLKRFLGCLEYSFDHSSICHNHEYNFIFEVESDSLNIHTPIPRLEGHVELMWMPLSKLDELDFQPEPLKVLIPKWLELPMDKAFRSMMV